MSANPQVGEPLATQFVALARERRDPELLVLSLRALAWAYRAHPDHAQARLLLDEAVSVARHRHLPAAEGLARVTRAVVRLELGQMAAAHRDLDAASASAAAIARTDPETSAEIAVGVTFQRAVAEQNAGELLRAQQRYRELLDHPSLPEPLGVRVSNNLALILAQRGVHEEAERRADDAVRRAAALGLSVLAPIMASRAWVAVQAGRLSDGLRYFEEAAQVYARAGMPLGEHYAEYADAMTDLRLLPEASAAATRAVEEFDAAGIPLMGAEAQFRVARIALLSGDYASAASASRVAADSLGRQRRSGWRARAVLIGVESRLRAGSAGAVEFAAARRAATILERAGNLASAVEAHLVAGRVALSLGPPRRAVEPLGKARALAGQGPVLVRIRGRVAGALAARARDDDRRALAECRAGLRDLAAHRSSLPTMELRALASGHGAELGEIGLGVVVRTGTASRVLDWMERTRAAALAAIAPGPMEGLKELRQVHREAAAAEHAAEALARAGAGYLVSPAGGEAAREQERRIRAASWRAKTSGAGAEQAAEPPPTTSLSALRGLLDGRVLVEFGRLEGRVVAFVVTPRRAQLVELGRESDVVEHLRALFFSLRRMANPRAGAAADGARASADLRVARLRAQLLEPLRAAPLGVRPDDELVVVPVGPLHGVPWSALHGGPVSLAPSATFWARTRRTALERPLTEAGTDASTTVLIAGPDLVGASEEVEALRAVHPDARVLGATASLADDVIGALRTAELGHLACHGWLRADNPMFSALILADGPVTVQELHSANVAPHRLVLASCHSGADVAYAGDEVIGFVSAVLAQGTAGVVASIAAIPDVAAVDLMLELHREIRAGSTLAHALHAARGRIDRETPEGYVNWCTFSAHGAA